MTVTERRTAADRAEYARALERADRARWYGDLAGHAIAAGQAAAALRRILAAQAVAPFVMRRAIVPADWPTT